MFTVKIAPINSEDALFQEQFETEPKAKEAIQYQIPSFPVEKLKPNTKLSHADTYSVSLIAKQSLPEAKSADEDTDLSDQSVAESMKAIEETSDLQTLTTMLNSEKTGKKRKTVIDAIEKKLTELK